MEQNELFAILDEVIEQRADQLREVKMTGAQALINQGKREGHQEGLQEGLREALVLTLTARFEAVPKDIMNAIIALEDRDLLMKLQRAAVQSATIDEFRNLLTS